MSKIIDASKRIQGKSIEKTTKELAADRLAICKPCKRDNGKPMIIKITGQCVKCWCVITDKVNYAEEVCPIDKW